MHFLICIGGEEYSRDTLSFGVRLAAALQADVSVLFVEPEVSYLFRNEARLARLKLEQWEIETLEDRVLKGVEKILLEEGFLRTVDGRVDVRHLPKPGIRGAYEYHLYGAEGENVRIRVREGEIVHTILRETLDVEYDLVVVGAPGDGGRLVRQIIQYVDTSVLIVRNPRPGPYRLLLCLDDSRSARKAEQFAVRAAKLLKASVDVLSIYNFPWEEAGVKKMTQHTQRLMKRFGIPSTVRVRRGPVARTILREAEPEHIVLMGSSRRSLLSQLFLESTPVKIGRQGSNPVLVVK